jgi:hypothetical protein
VADVEKRPVLVRFNPHKRKSKGALPMARAIEHSLLKDRERFTSCLTAHLKVRRSLIKSLQRGFGHDGLDALAYAGQQLWQLCHRWHYGPSVPLQHCQFVAIR